MSESMTRRPRPDAVTLIISSFFGTGFFPFAPATFASAILAVVLYAVGDATLAVRVALLVGVSAVGVWAATRTERRYGHDASVIVIDEIAGMLLSVLLIPWDALHLAAAFFVFRVMDILKPPPVYQWQSLPEGWGVMIDDLGAGAYTVILLLLAGWLVPGF